MEWTMADKFTLHKTELERRFAQVQDFHPANLNLWVATYRSELDKVAEGIAGSYQGLRTGDKQNPRIFITPHEQGDYLFVVYPDKSYTDPEEFNEALWELTKDNLIAAMRGRVLYGLEMLSPQLRDVKEENGSKAIRTPGYLQLEYRLGSPSGIMPIAAVSPGSTAPAIGQLSTVRYNGDIFLKQWGAQFPYFLLRKSSGEELDPMRSVALEDIRGPFAKIMGKLYNVTEATTAG